MLTTTNNASKVTAAYSLGFNAATRTDKRPPKCKEGKLCGDVCIPRQSKCHENNSESQKLLTISSGVTNNKLLFNSSLSSFSLSTSLGAALLGLPLATYLAARTQYRSQIPRSAQLAKTAASSIQVPDINDNKTQITFTVGGFYGQFGEEAARKGEDYFAYKMQTEVLDDTHEVVKHRNLEFNLSQDDLLPTLNWETPIDLPTQLDAAKRVVTAHYEKTLEPVIKYGRNPEAVNLAAKVYAYKQKYPDKDINLSGHSAGGMITHETAEILKEMGVKTKVVNLASGWYGFTEKVGESYTISDRQDMYLQTMAIPRDPVYVGSAANPSSFEAHTLKHYMRSLEVQAKLKELLNRKPHKDALELVSTHKNYSQFLKQLKTILEQVYTDKIDQFLKIDIDKVGNISGIFRDRTKLIDFSIFAEQIEYKLKKNKRKDSYSLALALTSSRFDAPRGKPKCIQGISCGKACLAAGKVCRVNTKNVASSEQFTTLRTSALQLRSSGNNILPSTFNNEATKTQEVQIQAEERESKNPSAPSTPSIDDDLKDKSIRELKKKAAEVGVYRYSEMTKEQLIEAIKTTKTSPIQEERLKKTLLKRSSARQAVAGTEIGKLVKSWEQVQRLIKISGADPNLATGAIAAFLMGVTVQTYNRTRDAYRDGFQESADAAVIRAEKMPTNYIRKSNISFTVGGFEGADSSSQKLKQNLEDLATKEGATNADRWFRDDNDIIAFQSKNFDINPTNVSKKNPDGSYNPAYLGHVAVNGFGKMMNNFQNKRNEDAVELAATVYAYANRRGGTNGNTLVHKDKSINILAHSVGGMTARETMEIIARMPNGKEVLKRINLVALGTPDFGFTEKKLAREMTISSSQDPFSIFPKRNDKLINTVKGHEIEDYLSNSEVVEQIRRQFNYYAGTTYYQETQKRRRSKPKLNSKKTTPLNQEKSDSYRAGFKQYMNNWN